jgi:hypothetical protein
MIHNTAAFGAFIGKHKLTILLGAFLSIVPLRFWRGGPSDPFEEAQDLAGMAAGQTDAASLSEPDPGMRQRIEAALQKISEKQRKSIEDRAEADRPFFTSLEYLPEDQRREKLEEYFDQNPPSQGFGSGSPNERFPGGGGDPANGDPIPIPSPDVRQPLDQHGANLQENARGS